MAKIVEEVLVLKISRLVRDAEDEGVEVLDEQTQEALAVLVETQLPELTGVKGSVVEVERA